MYKGNKVEMDWQKGQEVCILIIDAISYILVLIVIA